MIDYEQFLSRTGRGLRESAIRKMGTVLAGSRDLVSFAPGYPAEDMFAWDEFAEIARQLLGGTDGTVLQYGPTRGYAPLIEFLVELMAERGVRSSPDQFVVTTGSQQGLDLVARVLVDPGDVVLIELPSYVGAITAFRAVGAALVGVAQEADGIDLAALDHSLQRVRANGQRVKALYVVPNFQNPTGLLLALEKRRRLIEWAGRHDVLIIEDDPYRDLYFSDVTTAAETRSLAADDTDGRVVYLSSFSKTLAPGFRVAWIKAPGPLATRIELAKQASDLCTGALDQRIVFEACRRGVLTRQLPRLRDYYRGKRDVMSASLTRHLSGRVTWIPPRGGFFLWARLAPPITAEALLVHARKQGVIFVTGAAFFVDGTGDDYLRLAFSAPSPERIDAGVGRLAAAITEMLAAPAIAVATS
jgi:2-aminoadipate transaminase